MKIQNPLLLISIISLSLMAISQNSQAIGLKACINSAITELEFTYCEIVKKGQGSTLPDFFGFRRNKESMQRLLLKRGAARTGVTIPKASETPSETRLTSRPLGTERPQTEPAKTSVTTSASNPQDIGKKQENDLTACSLNKEQINCNNQRYFLAVNTPENRLEQNALSDNNLLALPNIQNGQTQLQYLSYLYPRYIEKMLLIGLGDSTVSFTKFNAIYETSIQQGENFSMRFAEMYELLKQERRTMGIKQRYRNNFPESIESCMQLSRELIACDNVEQNWVYRIIL